MVQANRNGWWLIGLAAVAGFIAYIVFFARPADPQQLAKRMQAQMAQLRGLPFKRDVVIQEQTKDQLRQSTEGLLQRFSEPENEQIMRTLGLLASDETLAPEVLGKNLEPGPTGYYDPYSGRLMVVKVPNQLQLADTVDDMYARELYRALLDQHFDLKTYLDRKQRDGTLNNDEWLARQMVVEGETFYASVLRRVKQETGRIPEYLPLEQALEKKFQTDELIAVWDDPRMRDSLGSKRKPRREPGSLPTALTHLSNSVQRDGVLFADYVRERGRDELTKLYTTSQPVSTEQVLHPRKWFVGERPVKIQWPAFEGNAAFADWELVEQDVFGELLLRTIFRVHRLSSMMGNAPSGWNGDRYAVFKRRDSGDMLLLMYTVWDRKADATAFADAYRVVVNEKYAEVAQPVRILEEGRRVVIVEGGDESTLDAFMQFAQSAQESENTVLEK
jgi:hypothetical protein